MTKALQAAQTASATPTAHAMTVDEIRRRQQRLPGRSTVGPGPPVLADTTDPVVAAFVDAYDEAVETLGSVLPTIRGGLHGRCPSLMQRNVLRPLQASTPAGWPDMASPCTCADPWMGVGLDRIEEARASLALAADAWPAQAATCHCRRGTARRGGRQQGA
jgi:hypothetical protein